MRFYAGLLGLAGLLWGMPSQAAPTASKTKKPAVKKKFAKKPAPATPAKAVAATKAVPFGQLRGWVLAPEIRKLGSRFRVTNVLNKRQVIVELKPNQYKITMQALFPLVDNEFSSFLPRFEVLVVTKAEQTAPQHGLLFNGSEAALSMSTLGTKPSARWRRLGFSVHSLSKSDLKVLKLTAQLEILPTEPVQATATRSMVETQSTRKLFDQGWSQLAQKRYDLSLRTFSQILAMKGDLFKEQSAQASLGRAISLFHQEGCNAVASDLVEAAKDAQNEPDVAYYQGLCLLEAKKGNEALPRFQKLAESRNPKYGEQSLFYTGVTQESLENYEQAGSAYQDVLDYSSDESLKSLAKERLENVKRLALSSAARKKWYTVGLTVGLGYDSNAAGLPSSLQPADFQLSNESSPVLNSAFFLELNPNWSKSFDQRFSYTLAVNHYTSEELQEDYNSLVHDIGTSLLFSINSRVDNSVALSWTQLNLGKYNDSRGYLRSYNLSYTWIQTLGEDPKAPDANLDLALKLSVLKPVLVAASPELDIAAYVYNFEAKYLWLNKLPHVFGPGVSTEWHPAKGTETTNFVGSAFGTWDFPLSQAERAWYLSQELRFSYSNYYQSESSRVDKQMRYSVSLGKPWNAWLDTKLQIAGLKQLSSEKEIAQYNKFTMNLLLSALF